MKKRRGRGRPKWKPTAAERQKIRSLAAMRQSPKAIARMFGVSVPTLRKHCADELANAANEADSAVMLALFKSAIGSDGSGRANVRAAKLFTELRGLHPALMGPRAVPATGKRTRQKATAEEIAKSSSRFAPPAPPRLAAVDGELVHNTKPRSTGSDDEPSS